MTEQDLNKTTGYINYCYTYFNDDTIQKRILKSNLSDDDKIYLIERLADRRNWPDYPLPNTPWNPGPIYCKDTATTITSNNTDEYLTESCYESNKAKHRMK